MMGAMPMQQPAMMGGMPAQQPGVAGMGNITAGMGHMSMNNPQAMGRCSFGDQEHLVTRKSEVTGCNVTWGYIIFNIYFPCFIAELGIRVGIDRGGLGLYRERTM